jgi:hypothetical protein
MAIRIMTIIRLGCGVAAGALFDLFALRDAFAYSDRHWRGGHAIDPLWLSVFLLVVCSFVFSLKSSREISRPHPSASLLSSLDRHRLLVPLAILLGLTITHTIVLLRDVSVDPTSHNLLPFEYLIAWIVAGIPALVGAMLARAMPWVLNRIRAH